VNPYQFRVSLRLRHPTKDLSFASVQLGLTPRRQWTHGVPRTTPAGAPLEGVYTESYWVARLLGEDLHDSTDGSLDEALEAILEFLSPHRSLLERFRQDGGTLYLFVGIFGPKNFGLEFSPALLGKLGHSGLEIGLDVYPGAPNDVSHNAVDTPD
jgi:Domain of unknown function (DUF4279)